jgi:hypothetical protein
VIEAFIDPKVQALLWESLYTMAHYSNQPAFKKRCFAAAKAYAHHAPPGVLRDCAKQAGDLPRTRRAS